MTLNKKGELVALAKIFDTYIVLPFIWLHEINGFIALLQAYEDVLNVPLEAEFIHWLGKFMVIFILFATI